MIIRLGHMYLSYFEVDNYNTVISISFTSKISDAKVFNDEDMLIVRPIIENLFMVSIDIVYSEEG